MFIWNHIALLFKVPNNILLVCVLSSYRPVWSSDDSWNLAQCSLSPHLFISSSMLTWACAQQQWGQRYEPCSLNCSQAMPLHCEPETSHLITVYCCLQEGSQGTTGKSQVEWVAIDKRSKLMERMSRDADKEEPWYNFWSATATYVSNQRYPKKFYLRK